jgi:hypothetical protein
MATGFKSGGREKGTLNKASEKVAEKLAALDCDPIEGMAKIAKIAMEEGDFNLAGKMYSDLAQYVAPKLKALEHSGSIDGVITITSIQRKIVDGNPNNPHRPDI